MRRKIVELNSSKRVSSTHMLTLPPYPPSLFGLTKITASCSLDIEMSRILHLDTVLSPYIGDRISSSLINCEMRSNTRIRSHLIA